MRIPPKIAEREIIWRRIVIGLGVLVIVLCATRAIGRADDGDFKVHWETGRRFLAGEFLYTNGADFPYLPILGMIFAPAALLPMAFAKAVCFPLGVAALLVLLWTLQRLVRPAFRLDEKQAFWAGALAVFLAGRFIIRDQAELGFNTAIAALTWLGIYLWTQRRDLLAGIPLGLAVAIKCTPAIFIGYFIWKRQWRVTIWTLGAVLFFTVLPIVWQGPASWTHHIRSWAGNATHGISGTGSGFEANEIFRVTNLSLRPALMHYLTHLPRNSERFWEPPPLAYLNLPPVIARWFVNSFLFGLFAIFLWWSRRAVESRDDPRLLWEFAAAAILMLLFSPITWGQHCVHLLPVCYLIAALLFTRGRLPRWVVALLIFYVLFGALIGRDLIGKYLSIETIRHHTTTFTILALLAIVLAGPRLQRQPN